ncbi:LiaF transmembrane domain-containing protein [Chengkuizengella axinellae]|uniref:DUF5668 domain-containing protein n=1 Tax=Chengkuizengella axinellae TaxID=3064388 RepID=A0ABT9IY82_9BACL|nr:DUF5668 domain-containing protein [Chengkuizengella sp. 2205SS18-9]MDP5274287.1 DUF5668 domain-containing protein [Chengkuizengella sp. 2205SS18-9]
MNGKHLFGLVVILVGVFLLLHSTEIIEFNLGDLIRNYWPMIIVISGLFNLINKSSSKIGAIIVISVGVLLQLKISDMFNIFEYVSFWPVLLILLGLWIMFSKGDKSYKKHWSSPNLDTKDSINKVTAFSGTDLKNVSQDFNGGSIVVAFGDTNLNLREANITSKKEVTIDVVVAFGGADIYIPENWNVEFKGVPIFGDWSNRTLDRSTTNPEAPTLILNCVIVFGGLDIKN